MTDLAEWLLAQIADDEQAARNASPGPWELHHAAGTGYRTLPHAVKLPGQQAGDVVMISTAIRADADHVARWDPKRVLDECAAKRKLLTEIGSWKHAVCEDGWYTCAVADEERDGGECFRDEPGDECDCGASRRRDAVLRTVAAPYADRPGYRDEWKR